MKYEIGDKIIVLHSDEEGTIVDFINDKMIMIEVRGVKFPAYMDQIDFPYFKMFSQKKTFEKKKIFVDDVKKEKTIAPFVGRGVGGEVNNGVRLNFIPVYDKDVFDDDVLEKIKVYLINQNNETYHFNYHLILEGSSDFNLKNTVKPQSDFYLHDVNFEDISNNPKFEFEFSLDKPDKNKAPYFEAFLKLRGKQLFKKIQELQLKNESSFSLELFNVYPDKKVEEKVDLTHLGSSGYRMYEATKATQHMDAPRSVVDLHFEKLSNSKERLSNFEILTMQLNTFEKYFELAVLHRQHTLIVIHGVGEGKLRNEIHDRLRLKSNVKSFVNQFHPLYGFGATEIYFSY